MALHPIRVLAHVIEEYRDYLDYLLTEFRAKDPELRAALERELEAPGFLAREPFFHARFIVFASRYDRMRRRLFQLLQSEQTLPVQRAVELLSEAGVANHDNPHCPNQADWIPDEVRNRIQVREEAPLLDEISVNAGIERRWSIWDWSASATIGWTNMSGRMGKAWPKLSASESRSLSMSAVF